MNRHLLAASAVALLVLYGCGPSDRPAGPAASEQPVETEAGGYKLIILFEGLTTLVPDGSTSPPTLRVLLGDYTDPTKSVVNKANGKALAAHQARLYFQAPDDSYTASGWPVVKLDPDAHCDPPESRRGRRALTPDRFIVLDGDDLSLAASAQPRFTAPKKPANLPEVPDKKIKAKNFGWTPDLSTITGQKIHADLLEDACPTRCDQLLAARLTTNLGRLRTAGLWPKGTDRVGNPIFKRWEFAGAPQWGVHAMAKQVALTMKVSSGPVRFESKTFDGTKSRALELPAPGEGRDRYVWITNDPFEVPPDCEGGEVDFIGHHNLLADPDAISRGKPPFPQEHPPGPPQFDGQCSPAQGGG